MKATSKYFLPSWLMVLMILFGCDRSVRIPEPALSVLKVNYSGCFLTQNISPKLESNQLNDSVYFDLKDSELTLGINMVYNCCGSLKDSSVVSGNDINIYVYDSCTQNCICKCLCLYKLMYSFTGFSGKSHRYKIYLKGVNDKDYAIWREAIYTGS